MAQFPARSAGQGGGFIELFIAASTVFRVENLHAELLRRSFRAGGRHLQRHRLQEKRHSRLARFQS